MPVSLRVLTADSLFTAMSFRPALNTVRQQADENPRSLVYTTALSRLPKSGTELTVATLRNLGQTNLGQDFSQVPRVLGVLTWRPARVLRGLVLRGTFKEPQIRPPKSLVTFGNLESSFGRVGESRTLSTVYG